MADSFSVFCQIRSRFGLGYYSTWLPIHLWVGPGGGWTEPIPARWDTGADFTTVSRRVAAGYGIRPNPADRRVVPLTTAAGPQPTACWIVRQKFCYADLPGWSFVTEVMILDNSSLAYPVIGHRDVLNHFLFHTPEDRQAVDFLLRDPGLARPGRARERTPGG